MKRNKVKQEICERGFDVIIETGQGKHTVLNYRPCGYGFDVFEKGKYIHHVNDLFGDV